MSQVHSHVYDGEGDRLMSGVGDEQRIILLPDTPETKLPETQVKLRLLWGQHLLEDVLANRYRSLVCAVNAQDNHRGIIAQVAAMLPTSQWDHESITAHARRFVHEHTVTVVKFDLDAVEILGLLRPGRRPHLTVEDLAAGFKIVAEMVHRRPDRWPTASVSFLGGRVNQLRDDAGSEPSFETALRVIYEAGYRGDVYPPPAMWEAAPTAVYPRFPFPTSIETMRQGGF